MAQNRIRKEDGRHIPKNYKLETYKKKYKKGDLDEVFKYYLGKICQRFIKKYDTRKQKEYMRSSLLNTKSLSLYSNYLDSRYSITIVLDSPK